MKNTFLSILFIAFLGPKLFCQTVIITGRAEAYKGNEISLYYYEDYLTFHPVALGTSLIDSDGGFKIKASVPITIKAFLKIENLAAQIFLEPYKNYQVSISEYDSAISRQEGKINVVPLKILNQETTELNFLITDFNKKYDVFLNDNYPLLVTKQGSKKIDAFKKENALLYNKINNRFFTDFTEYSSAVLDQLSYSNKYKLFSKYLNNKPILYQNPEYMAFFREYFTSHMMMFSQSKNGAEIVDIINKKDFSSALVLLKRDSLLQNDALRELVLIKGLYENYYSGLFEQKAMDAIFASIVLKSPFPEHRKIAENIILKTSKLAPGQPAPNFKLLDSRGKETTLEDFKGKPVYLNFYAAWCLPCLQEIKVIEKLQQKYGDKVTFITISTDKTQNQMEDFLKKNKYNWTFMHYSYDKRIKDLYDVTNLPAYFLIGADGKFIQSPAESPVSYIDITLAKLTQPIEKRIKVGDK